MVNAMAQRRFTIRPFAVLNGRAPTGQRFTKPRATPWGTWTAAAIGTGPIVLLGEPLARWADK